MSVETHDFSVEMHFLRDGLTAWCSCGWSGRKDHDDIESAREEWDDHCEQRFIDASYETAPGY